MTFHLHPGSVEATSADGRLLHTASRVVFPMYLGGLRRGATNAYDEAGLDLGVTYKDARREECAWLSVFVFPENDERNLAIRFREAEIELLSLNGDCEVLSRRRFDLRLPSEKIVNAFAMQTTGTHAFGKNAPVHMWLTLLRVDHWYLKVRVTAAKSRYREGEVLLAASLRDWVRVNLARSP